MRNLKDKGIQVLLVKLKTVSTLVLNLLCEGSVGRPKDIQTSSLWSEPSTLRHYGTLYINQKEGSKDLC